MRAASPGAVWHELPRSVSACAVAYQLCSSPLDFQQLRSNKNSRGRNRNPFLLSLFTLGRREGSAGVAMHGLASRTQPLGRPR